MTNSCHTSPKRCQISASVSLWQRFVSLCWSPGDSLVSAVPTQPPEGREENNERITRWSNHHWSEKTFSLSFYRPVSCSNLPAKSSIWPDLEVLCEISSPGLSYSQWSPMHWTLNSKLQCDVLTDNFWPGGSNRLNPQEKNLLFEVKIIL